LFEILSKQLQVQTTALKGKKKIKTLVRPLKTVNDMHHFIKANIGKE